MMHIFRCLFSLRSTTISNLLRSYSKCSICNGIWFITILFRVFHKLCSNTNANPCVILNFLLWWLLNPVRDWTSLSCIQLLFQYQNHYYVTFHHTSHANTYHPKLSKRVMRHVDYKITRTTCVSSLTLSWCNQELEEVTQSQDKLL